VSQLVAKKDQIKTLSDLLTSAPMQAQLKRALPKHIDAGRLARLALTQFQRVPELLQCDRESLLGSIMEAAQLGLEIGVAGQCWILPYKGKAQFICGYRGMAQLAWRSSMVASMTARAVFEGDRFEYDFGADKLSHVPAGSSDPAKLTHAYAILHTTTGGRLWDVMTRSEIEAVRKRSPSASSRFSPWLSDYAEMAKKTVFRRMMKLAPCSVEITRAMELEDAADRGEEQVFGDVAVPEERDVTPPKNEPAPDGVDLTTGEVTDETGEPQQGSLA